MKYLLSAVLFLIYSIGFAQEKRNCKKSFSLEGIGTDGIEKKILLTVTKRFYDFSAEGLRKQNADDKIRYAGYDYIKIGEPTQKQDCAGYVFDKLWHAGRYWIMGPNFYETIIKNFATKISNGITWGSVQEGDVVVYIDEQGRANHITIVKAVSITLGVTTGVTIETKDGIQGVFRHTLPNLTSLTNDPLVRSWGTPTVFRVNASKIKLVQENSGDCDIEFSFDKWAGVWYKINEPYKLTISGSAGAVTCVYEDAPLTKPGAYHTDYPMIDHRKIFNCVIHGTKMTGEWTRDEFYNEFQGKKHKWHGKFEMELMYSTMFKEWSLYGSTYIEGEDCIGCTESFTWLRKEQF